MAGELLWQVGSHQADSVLSCHRSYDVGTPFQWKGIEQGGVELRRDAGISWQREQILLHLGHLGHCHSLTGIFSTLLLTKTNSIHSLIVSHNTAQEFHSCRSFCFIQATLVIVSWKTWRIPDPVHYICISTDLKWFNIIIGQSHDFIQNWF